MLIDCDTCAVRGHGCADCVMTVLLAAPPAGVELDATEQAAIGVLADHGLVPPLRLVPPGITAGGSADIAGRDTLRLSCVRATG
jgi:hypothetical protein